jgi:hypothetical protein
MGFAVTSIHRVPQAGFDWYVYVVCGDASTRNAIDERLAEFGYAIGRQAAFVTGTEDYNRELLAILQKSNYEGLTDFQDLFHTTPCLLISSGNLLTTSAPVYVLPIPSLEETTGHALTVLRTLVDMIEKAIAANSMETLFKDIGARQVALSALPGGVVVATLARFNQVVKLEPNVFGIGINLNRIVEKWLKARQRA